MNEKAKVVTMDKSIEGGVAHEDDMKIYEAAAKGDGFEIKSAEQLNELARMAHNRMDGFEQDVKMIMRQGGTFEEQRYEFVRRLRVDEGYSWRGVAAACYQAWKGEIPQAVIDNWHPASNQLMGMALCQEAALLHGEDYMTEPWN